MFKVIRYSALIAVCLVGGALAFGDIGSFGSEMYKGESMICVMEEVDTSPIVVIVPHPDDEAFGFAGTLGAAVAAGAPVRVYLLSDGEYAKAANEWALQHMDSCSSKEEGLGEVERAAFGLARRTEFINSMEVLGISTDSLVFLGGDCGRAVLESPLTAHALAEYIAQDCAQMGFSLCGATKVFTVAPQLGDCAAALFYGEQHKHQIPQAHELSVSAAALLSAENQELNSSNVYFFKVYAHSAKNAQARAPFVFVARNDAGDYRLESIEQYSEIGKISAPNIYRGARRSQVEYASTLEQVRDAGFKF
ncbi:MAG: PIG-L family deacetylase [Coriobacteriia bacterium]|nr:PIG-L family deacetylase [Coriobacteriia bacterium]